MQHPLLGILITFLRQSRQVRALKIYQWLRLVLDDHPELSEHIGPLLEQDPQRL
jgi:hypothetical protein